MKKILLFIMLIGMAQFATAATIRVKSTGTVGVDCEAQTLVAGLALVTGEGFIIQIEDSATYTEAIPSPLNRVAGVVYKSLTIQAAPGQSPILVSTGNAFLMQGNLDDVGPFNYVIRGAASPAPRMRLALTVAAAGQNVVSVNNPARNYGGLTLENLTLERPVVGAANGGGWLNLANRGASTVTNVNLIGGDAFCTGRPLNIGNANLTPAGVTSVITNLDVSTAMHSMWYPITAGGSQFAQTMNAYGGNVTFNNCKLVPPAGCANIFDWSPAGSAGTLTFNNCEISAGLSPVGVTPAQTSQLFQDTGSYNIVINGGTVGAASGRLMILQQNKSITFAGTPTQKLSLAGFAATPQFVAPTYTAPNFFEIGGANVAPGVPGGTLNLTDVSIVRPNVAGQPFWYIRNWYTNTANTINIDRCFFQNISQTGGFIWSTVGSNMPALTVNITNTVWKGPDDQNTAAGTYFNILGANNFQVILNLTHSTFIGLGGTPATGVNHTFFHNHSSGKNFITSNYCVFDDRNMGNGACSFTHGSLTGGVSFVAKGSFLNVDEPASWIKGTPTVPLDPKLTVDGRLTDLTSPLSHAAVGSKSTSNPNTYVDIDGIGRPLAGKDIGASNTPVVNASSGWTSFE